MKKITWTLFFSLIGVFLLSRCVEPFDLPSSASNVNFLVVEGSVDVDNGTAIVKLSRTQNLSEPEEESTVDPVKPSKPRVETVATVFVETEDGEVYQLFPDWNSAGVYREVNNLRVSYGTPYRLRIKTSDGKEYLSAFVSTQKTPAIDKVGWHVKQNGVQITVDTHDPKNSTRYYKWDYEEMYEYTSYFRSMFVYRNGQVVARPANEDIYRCWKTEPNKAIFVGTTVQLGQDVVTEFPLAYHEGNSVQFGRKYSILVKQYGISKAEYEYWQMLKKNTENVGSIFDAQPSQVTGNVTCVSNPGEPVLGYFSARSVETKRIFIDPLELREKYGLFYHNVPVCYTDTISTRDLPQWLGNGKLIVDELLPPFSGYVMGSKDCTDCRTKGGTTTKPVYWE